MSAEEVYVLRKYVMAANALEAIRLDKKTPVAEVVLLEEKSLESETERLTDAVGFQTVEPDDD